MPKLEVEIVRRSDVRRIDGEPRAEPNISTAICSCLQRRRPPSPKQPVCHIYRVERHHHTKINKQPGPVTPNSYVLLHSPLTGPAAWGRLPTLLREHGYDVIVVNVQDDDEAPFAERYVTRASAQISAAQLTPPTVFVAHSGAGPLLPPIAGSLPRDQRPRAGYVFLDAGLPRAVNSSRLDLLREEDPHLAADFLNSLEAGARFPAWTVDELAAIVPNLDDRIDLVNSLRPRGRDFFTEPLPAAGEWPDAPCGYLRTSAAYDYWVRIAEQRGWPVVHRDLGHFAALASPEVTLNTLLELTSRM